MSDALLADIVDIRRWLEGDASEPFEARRARDREIGRAVDASGATSDLARVRAWWQAVSPDVTDLIGARVAGFVRLATVLLFVGGMIAGVGVASVAFAYDGSHPVNLLSLLGALVGLPLVLLVLSLLLLLPGRVPGFDALRETVAVVNPGRWAGAWLDRLAGIDLYGGFTKGRTAFARWQLVVFSQWLAVGFFVGTLGSAWVRVAVTDLAFGWSTTLDLRAETVYAVFNAMALPWKEWLAVATPDLALVEASQFNRLETAPISKERAVLLGGWWPFVLTAILFYGLLPRLVLLAIGGWRLGSATRAMLLRDSEVVGLLDRLEQPHVTFEQEEDGAVADDSTPPSVSPTAAPGGEAAIVIWNDAVADEAARQWTRSRLNADGAVVRLAAWLKADRSTEALAGLGSKYQRVIVITKGWEPPLLEFGDFLTLLRQRVGDGATIIIVPIDLAGRSVDAADRAVWARALAKHEDPRLYVMQGDGEAT